MEIIFENVCNIKSGRLIIHEDILNIKYGANGIGKSSCSKGVEYSVNDSEKLQDLKPYGTQKSVVVNGTSIINSIKCFDTDYIKNYLFSNNSLVTNTFDVILKTDEFSKHSDEINQSFSDIKEFIKNDFDIFIKDTESILSDIKVSDKTGKLIACKAIKGYDNGALVKLNFDEITEKYKKYFNLSNNYEWLKWINVGSNFIDDKTVDCPFCGTKNKSFINDKIIKVKEISTEATLKNNVISKTILGNADKYTSSENKKYIKQINGLPDAPSNIEKNYFVKIRQSINELYLKIQSINKITREDLMNLLNSNLLQETLNNSLIELDKINLENVIFLKSIEKFNTMINDILKNINELKKSVRNLNIELKKNIKNNKKYVNDFLQIAGIPYVIDIKTINKEFVIQLSPKNFKEIGLLFDKKNLSFGEKNAIALILFSLGENINKHEMIILDDPVSSFDNSKKYALMNYLFNKKGTFYKKTVLMFTHDITPVIDFIKLGLPAENIARAYYIKNEAGILSEQEITKNEIVNSITIEKNLSCDTNLNIIIRLVHLRRYIELSNNDSILPYNMISSAIHLEDKPRIKKYKNLTEENEFVDMTNTDKDKASAFIKNYIKDFDYDVIYKTINDKDYLLNEYKNSSDPNEKLCIIRVLMHEKIVIQNKGDDLVLWKFLCDEYHIENEMVFGLNITTFNMIPDYIIKLCDLIVEKVK